MKQNIDIEKLFQEKLGNFESPVSPDVWANISSSIGAGASGAAGTTAVVKTGMSGLMKTIIISSSVVAAGLVTAYVVTQNDQPENNVPQTPVIVNTGQSQVAEAITLNPEQAGDKVIEENRETIVSELKEAEEAEVVFTPQLVEQILIEIEKSAASDINLESIVTEAEENVGDQHDVNNPASNDSNPTQNDIAVDSQKAEVEPESDIEIEPEVARSAVIINCCSNVFTPDGDRANDVWPVRFENAEKVYIQIVDKNNNVVMVSTEAEFDWDGRDRAGNELPGGVYYYLIIATDADGKPAELRGQVNMFLKK